MWSAASVLVCALSVLGRSERSMPPIELLDTAPREASAGVEAFVRRSTRTIYLITSSPTFREAMAVRGECSVSVAVKKLASILVHEEWHVLHGPDEKSAYEVQLTTLHRLGVAPGSAVYQGVQRSMLHVLDARTRQQPDLVLASR